MKFFLKNILSIILLLGVLVSCKENKLEILQDNIEDKIKAGLNDPDSYEFNHFYIDSIEFDSRNQIILENIREIENLQKLSNDKTSSNKILDLQNLNSFLKNNNKYKFTGGFSFRGNNKFGAKILAEYNFVADSSYTLIYLIDNVNDTIYKDVDVLMRETDELLKNNSN